MKIRSALNIGAITKFLKPLAMSLSDAIRLKDYPSLGHPISVQKPVGMEKESPINIFNMPKNS